MNAFLGTRWRVCCCTPARPRSTMHDGEAQHIWVHKHHAMGNRYKKNSAPIRALIQVSFDRALRKKCREVCSLGFLGSSGLMVILAHIRQL
mmetsp:Transcript_15354/g.29702  ORF Transcript_15354/g.29702 Transcript_15354/m.29702 type:complete len:91 (-) Transcript_15354:1751-2023(-)